MPFRGTAGDCWHPLGTISMWVPGSIDVWPWFESHQDLLAPGMKETSRIGKDHPAPLPAAIPKPSHHPGDMKEPVPPSSAHVPGCGSPCPSFKHQETIEICTGKDTQDQTQPLILPASPRAVGLARLGGGEHRAQGWQGALQEQQSCQPASISPVSCSADLNPCLRSQVGGGEPFL